jgi:uncharacterized protein with GYD domain
VILAPAPAGADSKRISAVAGPGRIPDAPVAARRSKLDLFREIIMATYVILGNFTEQGIRNVKDSPKRAQAFREMAQKLGVTIKDIYYTVGRYDLLAIAEGTDEAVTSALLSVGALGNVRTQTLRAFSAAEFAKLVGNLK